MKSIYSVAMTGYLDRISWRDKMLKHHSLNPVKIGRLDSPEDWLQVLHLRNPSRERSQISHHLRKECCIFKCHYELGVWLVIYPLRRNDFHSYLELSSIKNELPSSSFESFASIFMLEITYTNTRCSNTSSINRFKLILGKLKIQNLTS